MLTLLATHQIMELAGGTLRQASAPVPPAPASRIAFEALVDIAPTDDLGRGSIGTGLIVPTLVDIFAGSRIEDKVRVGGADRQLVHDDRARQPDVGVAAEPGRFPQPDPAVKLSPAQRRAATLLCWGVAWPGRRGAAAATARVRAGLNRRGRSGRRHRTA